jgi:hypothetical protein
MRWLWLGALCTSLAAAADGQPACADDAAKLCPSARAGSAEQAGCLQSHAAVLSAGCKASLAAMPADSARIRESCQADVRRICPGVTPGQGRLRACLAERADKLSPACRAALFDPPPESGTPLDDCHVDAAKLCPGLPTGDGRLLRCLAEHHEQLSQVCSRQTDAIRGAVDDLDKACKSDVETVCKGVQPGHGRLLGCLRDHSAQLSPACAALLSR